MKNPLSELMFGSEDLYGHLFPVLYDGKSYTIEDSDPDYVDILWNKGKPNNDGSVYLPDGNRLFPDGSRRFG